jgi:hypothetical protein
MTKKRQPAPIRQSDLTPVFNAAKAAGFDHVSVIVEVEGGKRFLIKAGTGGGADRPDMSPYDIWRAGRAS